MLVFTLLLVSTVYGLSASAGPARMFLEVETGDPYDGEITVRNPNDKEVNVKIAVTGNIAGLLEMDEEEFIMDPDEDTKVGFEINVNKPGYYTGSITVRYSELDSPGGVVASISMNILADGEDLGANPTPSDTPYTTPTPLPTATPRPRVTSTATPSPTITPVQVNSGTGTGVGINLHINETASPEEGESFLDENFQENIHVNIAIILVAINIILAIIIFFRRVFVK